MKINRIKKITMFALFSTLILLAACSSSNTPEGHPTAPLQPTTAPTMTTGIGKELENTYWVLSELDGNSLMEDTWVTLEFGQNEIGGFAGCNAYGISGATAQSGFLSIPDIEITLEACLEPPGVLEQESAYVKTLQKAATYRVEYDTLLIDDAEGKSILVLTKLEKFSINPDDLVGSAWRLVSLDEAELLEGSTITLIFSAENQATGSAGCRDYVASYEPAEDGIRFTQIRMVGADCPDREALMIQENDYTTLLGWTVSIKLEKDRLEIMTGRGELLIFEALDPDDLEQAAPLDHLISPIPAEPDGSYPGPDSSWNHSMKGVELYSWQENGEWYFSLVVGTNRNKCYEEVTSGDVRIKGIDALVKELERLAEGEALFWTDGLVAGTELPPSDMIEAVQKVCQQRNIQLTTSALP